MQMPSPRDIVIHRPVSQALSVVQKPWGWAHILVQKPRVPGGMVTGQIDTCIIYLRKGLGDKSRDHTDVQSLN